jgi:hypothetical protein
MNGNETPAIGPVRGRQYHTNVAQHNEFGNSNYGIDSGEHAPAAVKGPGKLKIPPDTKYVALTDYFPPSERYACLKNLCDI